MTLGIRQLSRFVSLNGEKITHSHENCSRIEIEEMGLNDLIYLINDLNQDIAYFNTKLHIYPNQKILAAIDQDNEILKIANEILAKKQMPHQHR